MTEWRVAKNLRLLIKKSSISLTVEEIFPDVDKTVIYPKLLEWGIDARKVRVEHLSPIEAMGATMMAAPYRYEGKIFIAVDNINRVYPTNEDKYVGLVHELAHLLQTVEGRIISERKLGFGPEAWIAAEEERDAIWWSAMQARKMGWSKEKFLGFLKQRYPIESGGHTPATISQILLYGGLGWERQTRLPIFEEFIPHRRPVHVRQHRRRK